MSPQTATPGLSHQIPFETKLRASKWCSRRTATQPKPAGDARDDYISTHVRVVFTNKLATPLHTAGNPMYLPLISIWLLLTRATATVSNHNCRL